MIDIQVDLRTSFAAGMVQDGKLFLLPINDAMSMRPQLSHLDHKPAEPKPALKAEGIPADAASPVAVTVRPCSTCLLTASGNLCLVPP